MIAELKYGRSGKYIAARGAVARVTAMNATTTRARHRIAATIAAMMSQGMTMTMPDPDPRAPVPADHQWGDELINDARVCQRCGVRWEQGPVPRIPCLLPAPVPADPWAQVQDALYDAHDRLDHAVDAARAQAEQQHAQNERLLFERLSMALTGGNAATWDEVLHAVEHAEADLAQRTQERDEVKADLARLMQELDAWKQDDRALASELVRTQDTLAALQAAHTALQALCQELADRLAALTPPPAPPAPTGETP